MINTFINKGKDIYEVIIPAVHSIESTGSHPYLAKRGDKTDWIKAKDLQKGDYLMIPINTKSNKFLWEGSLYKYNNHNYYSKKLEFESTHLWYLIGRFIGDGWVRNRKDRNNELSGVIICCSHDELDELLPYVKKIFKNYK